MPTTGTASSNFKATSNQAVLFAKLNRAQILSMAKETLGKGNITFVSAIRQEAWQAGMAWVGKGAKAITQGNILIGYI
ncbi:hypothetical protein [Brevibacillus gelatini]